MRERRHHFRPILQSRAREMRADSIPAEKLLWLRLRAAQLSGFRFRRQQPIGDFIADFFCAQTRLIVELDGESHLARRAYDERRTGWLESQNVCVVRFPNTDVYEDMDGVLEKILGLCERRRGLGIKTLTPHPAPLPQGEREKRE